MSDLESNGDNDSIAGDENDIELMNSENVIKILLTTDNHLGFMEKDPERSADSFISFEEALEIAKQEEVDLILLGGDLFHENKPSRDCLTKCQKLLREHCFGTKPIEFEILSDENRNFGHTGFAHANFNDPNLNISIPVFSIHGNHDDPTGAQNLSAMDILAAAGLVNYFGKSNTACNTGIEINPVLIQKGCSKLAIFGLGSIKDERLHNMFEKGTVQFTRPTEEQDDWFNIFVIHQNRSAHGKKNYIPEGFLPNFLDLVVWGHEHECRIRPEYNELLKFFVTQPGSSVLTSLSESEQAPKHVGLLKIYKKCFKLEPIPLRSVRQFLLDTIVLSESGLNEADKNVETKIETLLAKKVNKMVDECTKNRYCYEKQPSKPLIRLKVDYTNFEPINENRFAQKFVDKLANPRSILQFYKKSTELKVDASLDSEAVKVLRMYGGNEQLEFLKVQDLVGKYFKKAEEKNKMMALTEEGLSNAIQEYIEKDEKDAIAELINFQIEKVQKYLQSQVKFENDIQLTEEIKKFQRMRLENQEENSEIKEIFEKSKKSTQSQSFGARQHNQNEDSGDEDVSIKKSKDSDKDDEEEEDLVDETPSTSALANKRGGRGRGASSTRGTRGGRGSRGGRGGTAAIKQVDSSKNLTAQSKASKSSKTYANNDSDLEIVALNEDEEDEMKTTKKSSINTRTALSKASKTSQITNKPVNTTPSIRRNRIQYEDDDDDNNNDDDDDDDSYLPSSNKKQKTLSKKNDSDNEIPNTYDIFKRAGGAGGNRRKP